MDKRPDFGELEVTIIERDDMDYKTYTLQWTIPNYSLIQPDKLHIMHNILIGSETCHFKLYKKQLDDYGNLRPHTDLILTLLPAPNSIRVRFGIIGGNNREIIPDSLDFHLHILNNEQQTHFIETSEIIIDDTLTISATLIVSVKGCLGLRLGKLSIFESIETSNMALGNLLQGGKFSDLQIVVGEETFSAHRSILCARSTVLAAMFESNFKEKVEKTFRIDDADAESVGEMLNFMYTGETKELDLDLASNLFQLADKYDLQGLRFKVANFLMQAMSISHALRTLILANMHSHADLKDYAIDFIGKNLSKAMRHNDWKDFRKKHNDLFESVLNRVAELYAPTSEPYE